MPGGRDGREPVGHTDRHVHLWCQGDRVHRYLKYFAGLDCLWYREPGNTGICPAEKERYTAKRGSEPHDLVTEKEGVCLRVTAEV